jgi:hypothetical protein
MKSGHLSQYFEAIAAKRLVAVEVDKEASHQHEFNGTAALKRVLGTFDTGEKKYFPTRFIWMGDRSEPVSIDGKTSWYNSRYGKPRAPEWRLFYPTNDVLDKAHEGDLLIIAKRTDGTVLIIIVAASTTVENQILWLFGVPVQTGTTFVYHNIRQVDDKEVDFSVRFILEELGLEVEEPEADYLDGLTERFNGVLPSTWEFSQFARQTLKEVNPLDDPDKALMAWMDREEKLFRRIERQSVAKVLRKGFIVEEEADVDKFISYSLSVQNRRKSRAGFALENHLEEIFRVYNLAFATDAETENKAKPDFLFPSVKAYHDLNFSPTLLTMLGVKTTCKDRWRQVLSEAKRIDEKHLFTLEPGISENQTEEMKGNHLQLVLPSELHVTYSLNQMSWILSLSQFIELTRKKQAYNPYLF